MIDAFKRSYACAFALSSAALVASGAPSEAATGVITRCSIPQPCALFKNLTGWGFQGITAATVNKQAGLQGADVSTNEGFNDGVLGSVINGGYGVEGTSGDKALGGVRGIATTGLGIYATSISSYGAFGSSETSAGVVGTSSASTGVYASSYTGSALEAHANAGDAGRFVAGTGTALDASTSTGYGLVARTGGSVGAYIVNTNGNGTDITGSYIGLLGRSDTFPMLLTSSTAANLFYVDGSGNVWSHGTYHTFATTRSGQQATAYSSQTTAPNVEDVGSAELVNGAALVKFEPAFAASIDVQRAYHVFLTPGGDTRGLFVASKTPSGFLVRETQGGRGTLTFDYRVVAQPVGHTHERMAFVAGTAAGEPHAANVRYVPAPAVSAPHVPKTRAGRPSP